MANRILFNAKRLSCTIVVFPAKRYELQMLRIGPLVVSIRTVQLILCEVLLPIADSIAFDAFVSLLIFSICQKIISLFAVTLSVRQLSVRSTFTTSYEGWQATTLPIKRSLGQFNWASQIFYPKRYAKALCVYGHQNFPFEIEIVIQ